MIKLADVQNNYLAIDFFLTMSCNKDCHYCTSYTLEQRNLTVDMDFLRSTLYYLRNYKVRCNLLGGEPGLVKNLDEVVAEIKSNPNHVCEILSNSTIRRRYPQVLKDSDIIYVEHFILDFYEHEISLLGPKSYEFHQENDMNNYNLVIKTPNFEKYKHLYPKEMKQLDNKNTLWKEFNGRAPDFAEIQLNTQAAEIDRKMCAAFPMVPVINFENQNIVHCSKKFANNAITSKEFKITQENIDKMMNFRLFKYENYCKTCTEFVQPKGHFPLKKYASILNE
jgi:organic radical activating enzyme